MSSLIPNLQSDVRTRDAPPSRLNNLCSRQPDSQKERVERSLLEARSIGMIDNAVP